jgi:hypothetical protein
MQQPDMVPILESIEIDGQAVSRFNKFEDYFRALRVPHLGDKTQAKFGSVTSFFYEKGKGKEAERRFAFVLHPNHEGKLHAIDLTKLTPRIAVEQLIPRMLEDQDPYSFYHSHTDVKKFMKEWDCYRTFLVSNIKSFFIYN